MFPSVAQSNNAAPALPWTVSNQHNLSSATSYIDQLFEHHSRLLFVRLDLYVADTDPGHDDPEVMKSYLTRLLNNRRCNTLFDHLDGYLWGFEHGVMRGFHFHTLWVFDGARVRQDITLGRAIGEYWSDTITDGTGQYYCSNFDKDSLADMGYPLAMGMIHRSDAASIDALKQAATYLLKDKPAMEDYFSETGKRFRTFGRGQ